MLRVSLCLIAFTGAAEAHEFEELTIANWQQRNETVEINIQGTVRGRVINCALFGADGSLITSDRGVTNNLATRELFLGVEKEVGSVQCVFDD